MALVTLAQLIVEAGFVGPNTGTALILDDITRGKLGTGTLSGDPLFSDISAYVRSVSVRRGATRVESPILRYEAASCTIQLDNSDRRFDPTNLSGPYVAAGVTQVQPRRQLRIRAQFAGVTYDMFNGFVDRWIVEYDREAPSFSQVTVTATDATEILDNNVRGAVAAVGGGEDSGARVNRILDSASWPAEDRVISTGDTTLQATTLEGDAWTELLLVQDTEIGEVYVDASGRVVFRNRHATMEDPRSALVNATFGDQPVTGAQTTINLARNPSLETDISGWGGGGTVPPTLTQSSAQAKFGTKSVLVTWGTDGFLPLAASTVTGLQVGRTYTASAYVYVPTGSPGVSIALAGVGFGTVTGLKDQWVRLTYTGVATGTSWEIQFWPTASPTSGQQVYIDGYQVEEGATATVYCDGSQTGCEWDGTANLSTSRRLPELPYSAVGIDYDDTTLANLVRVTRVGGTEQVAQDAASQAAYLIKTFTPPAGQLIMETDTAALAYAQFILYQAKDPELRFSTLGIQPQRDETALYPQALGRRMCDRIRIIRRPPGGGTITREVFIRGIEHAVTGDDWATVWTLQSATRFAFLILDNNILGQLDHNAMAY